jgi:hypothetical protein
MGAGNARDLTERLAGVAPPEVHTNVDRCTYKSKRAACKLKLC